MIPIAREPMKFAGAKQPLSALSDIAVKHRTDARATRNVREDGVFPAYRLIVKNQACRQPPEAWRKEGAVPKPRNAAGVSAACQLAHRAKELAESALQTKIVWEKEPGNAGPTTPEPACAGRKPA